MRRMLLAIMGVMLVAPSISVSGVFEDAIVFDAGYFGAPLGWNPIVNSPHEGDLLWIVGHVAEFNAPFIGMVPVDASHEATYAFDGFVCATSGMWDDDNHQAGGWFAEFGGGTLKVYLDDSPDADFADPGTFRDGEVLLEAEPVYLILGVEPPHYAWFRFTGGSLFNVVSRDGVGYQAENTGYFNLAPAAMQALGYLVESHTSLDVHAPILVEESTWGKIKAFYE